MPELVNHATLLIAFNGQKLKRATSVRLTGESGKTVVHTLDGESSFGGFSPGEALRQVEVTYAVPVSGPEFDFEKYNFSGEFLTCQYWYGDKTYSGLGQITSHNGDRSTNSPLSFTASWTGQAKPAK